MKFLYFLLIPFLGFSQVPKQSEEPKSQLTNTEKFSQKSGALIQKTYYDMGSVSDCQVQAINYIDLNSNQKVSAARFEYRNNGSHVAILDPDEIDGLIKSLRILVIKVAPTAPKEYTEVSYNSRGGFEAGGYFDRKKNSWSTYLRLEKYDNNSYVFMSMGDLNNLLGIMEKVKSKITLP